MTNGATTSRRVRFYMTQFVVLILIQDSTMLPLHLGTILIIRRRRPGLPEGGVMGEAKESSGKVNIDQELLSILCCPETKQDVALASESLITTLNNQIAEGVLKNKAGQPVTEKLDGGLIRADKKILYPIRDDIPVMLIEEGIPITGLG